MRLLTRRSIDTSAVPVGVDGTEVIPVAKPAAPPASAPARRRRPRRGTGAHVAPGQLPEQETSERDDETLAITHAHKHLALTDGALWAFFRLGGLDWPMRDQSARASIYTAQTHRWAELTGKRLWIRGTSSPFPHRRFARGLYDRYTSPLVPDDPDAISYEDMVDAAQLYVLGNQARRQVTVVGVRVTTDPPPADRLADLLSTGRIEKDKDGTLDRLRQELRDVTEVMSRTGLEAAPLRGSDLRWLTHACLGMGAPVPAGLLGGGDDVEPADVPGFTAPIVATKRPYGRTTRLRTLRGSTLYEGHVAVLHVESMQDRDLDNQALMPFLSWTQTLEMPVEYCAIFDVVDGRSLVGSAELTRRRAKNIADHHTEHGDMPPAAVMRGIERAATVEDEVTNAPAHAAARVRGVVMLALTGPDEESVCRDADRLTSLAASEQGMALVHDFGQYPAYRSFTPGEPALLTGHVVQWPTSFLAAGVPNATSEAGDVTGFLVGKMAGSADMLVLDPHGGTRTNKSNMILFGAEPGAGKSNLAGGIAAFTAFSGIRTVGFDPSGPWSRLTQVPYLRKDARHLSLTGGYKGVLVPHLLVPEPLREDYDSRDDYRAALQEAAAERMELCIDAFRDLLPLGMVAGDRTGIIQRTIEEAVTGVGGEYGTNPWEVVDRLSRMGEVGDGIAQALYARSQLKDGALVFPDTEKDLNDNALNRMLNSATLTIITMEGLTLPPANQPDRAHWTRAQLASVPILNLGARLAMRVVYADKRPKAVLLDELGISTGGAGSFSSFAVRSSFDSRKWNAMVGLIFQNPATLMALDPQISNLAGAAFIGRMSDETTARSALPLLRLDDESGYHEAIQALQTGEFLVRDWQNRVRKTRVDMDWWDPALIAALDTNPDKDREVADDVHSLVMAGAQ